MPTFTKEEIREFLIEQGFDVSDEETLEKFIRDFKKLIKYEQMKKRRSKLGHLPEETVLDSTTDGGNYGQTTSSTTQDTDTTSYEEVPWKDAEKSKSRPYQKSKDVSSRLPFADYGKEFASPKKVQMKGGSSKIPKSPGRQSTPQQVGGDLRRSGTGTTREIDKPSSYENRSGLENRSGGSGSGYNRAEIPRLTPLSRPGGSMLDPITTSTQKPTAPPKKRSNKLVMHRVTASQTADGVATIDESDINIGRGKRPTWNSTGTGWRPSSAHGRPQTAPRSEPFERKPSNPTSRPASAKPRQNDRNGSKDREDFYDATEPEPDELFHALNELIFPNDKTDSEDDSFGDGCGARPLLKPPPHVAIDPVALYHWYKTYNWDVYAIPGEDRHMKLRWNVRAKTVGGYHPCTEVRKYKPRTTKKPETYLNNPQIPICR